MDYAKGAGEAIDLAVIPGEGPSLQIHDTKSIVRAALVERSDSAPILYGLNLRSESTIDVGILRLSPYAFRRVVTKANDKALAEALEKVKP